MAKVVAIGGVFMKARDPAALRTWYRDVLGLEVQDWGGAQLWNEDGTFGVWSSFAPDTKYFEPSTREFMINFRVDDLNGVLTMLRERGARVLERCEDTDDGSFGYVVDPEGTLLELWQAPRSVEPGHT